MSDLTKTIDQLVSTDINLGQKTVSIVAKVAKGVVGNGIVTNGAVNNGALLTHGGACSNGAVPNGVLANVSATKTKTKQVFKTSSSSKTRVSLREDKLEKAPLHWAIMSYISYIFLVVTGYLRELIWGIGPIDTPFGREFGREGYAPLYSSFEGFYTRNIFRRFKPVVGQPITSVPGSRVVLNDRMSSDYYWTSKLLPTKTNCINLGSYNYLGYAENHGPCTDSAIDSIQTVGVSSGSTRQEYGNLAVHQLLEKTVAEFIGVDDAIACGMGFATNTLNIPSLVSKGCLVLSDELNHASLILGMRLSGATVMVFKHGSVEHLEKLLRQAIIKGHHRNRRPWKKIVIVVEGVYSMEGTIARLPEIVSLKKKYGAYIYLDEAHSVGAMGPNGRGVVDYYGLNPRDIDIMMGTFTKSFGSAGGYIAGSKELINYLRVNSQASSYATSVSPPVAMQIVAAMRQIVNREGAGLERIQRLADNSRYFRQRLQQMGLIVYGDDDSPVIPVLLIMPAKIRAFVEEMKVRYNIATVSVGFPAVPMTKERARFCMSSSHDKETLDEALVAIDKIADALNLRYSRMKRDKDMVVTYGGGKAN